MVVWGWVVLGVALVVASLGIFGCLALTFVAVVFVASCLVVLHWCVEQESDAMWLSIHRSHLQLPSSHQDKVGTNIRSGTVNERLDRRVTGSSIIDEQLQLVVSYVVRDFVMKWYTQLSDNRNFVLELQKTTQQALVAVANRCKSMDWVSFLTKRLVDDVASHLRIFREARTATRSKGSSGDLIGQFFAIEAEKEKDICREEVCLKAEAEKDYLNDLVEIVLYFALPPDDFSNAPLRAILIEILVSSVLLPLFNQLSDPDYINQLIVYACTDIPVTTELFVHVIKTNLNVEELQALKSLLLKEMANLRSKDCGGRDQGNEVKQQLSSLEFLKRTIEARIVRLGKGSETDSIGLPTNFDYRQLARCKLFQLPLEVILKNSLTLDHLLSYMASINSQHYIKLYLNIECWRATVTEHLCALELDRLHHLEEEGRMLGNETEKGLPDLCHDHFSAHDLQAHKDEAETIYEQYLSEKASTRVTIDDSIVKRLILRIRSEKVSETWFDEVQQALFTMLQESEDFLPSFRRSVWYIRLLAELDLLKDATRSDEEDSQSLDDVSLASLEQVEDADGFLCPQSLQAAGIGAIQRTDDSLSVGSSQSTHSADNQQLKSVSRGSSRAQSPQPNASRHPSPAHTRSPSLTPKPFTLTATIIGADVVKEVSKSHAIYVVSVVKKDALGIEEIWHVFRRYSEFHDFHLTVVSKFEDLSSISFPSKKMLNNLAAWFLEKRKAELDVWLQEILSPPTLQSHPGLQDLVVKFLDQTTYHTSQPQNLVKKMEDNLVAPIRHGVRSVSEAVRSMPDTVLNTVDGVVDGICRKLTRSSNPRLPGNQDFVQRGSIDIDGDENIPLRILLLLMDEVFDLRSKDQWFRRRIILFLRQILKAMFGDIVNKRIIDYVESITAPEQVADYVKSFRESLWPNGLLAPPPPNRDEDVRLRTKSAARICMLASLSDELKAILGSQTTARGVVCVYDTVQWAELNKRLVYVIIESFIESILINQKQIPSLLRSLHAGSPRVAARTAGTRSHKGPKEWLYETQRPRDLE